MPVLVLLTGCGGGSGGPQSENRIAQVLVSPGNPILAKGARLQLTATAVYKDGTHQDATSSATWMTSAPAVALVNGGGLSAIGAGTAQISAQYQGVSGNASVVVDPAALVSITVTPDPTSLPVGEFQQLAAIGTFTDGSKQDLTATASWNSSSAGVADVSASGLATAKAIGTATITATIATLTGSTLVTVTLAVPVALNIVPSTLSLVLGSSRQLRASETSSDGTTQDVTGQVQWSSSREDIVSVSGGGLCRAQQVGAATISASDSTLSASADVTVIPLALISYFDLASAQHAQVDGTLRLMNSGLTAGNLCAMIYVFDESQEMNECCGCMIPDNGLLTLSLISDLTSNPLTGQTPKAGSIKVVPSDPSSNLSCDPSLLTPTAEILGSAANVRALANGKSQIVESENIRVPLGSAESNALVGLCTAIKRLGNGQGICSCGTGH